jgi:glycosyltransferase involved in cell wall biosynthesis
MGYEQMQVSVRNEPACARKAGNIAVSVVAPCYNEEGVLDDFMSRISAVCAALGATYEIVLVNDGSRDKTWPMIQAAAVANPHIVGVNLARNHGHQLAVSAGLGVALGDRVLIIDADLQDPPEVLRDMMAMMDQGYDVVYGKRRRRASERIFKKGTATLFYRTLRILADVDIPVDTGDFRLLSRRVVDRLLNMPERDRFLRGMVAWLGGKQIALVYDRDPRAAGETKYTLRKMLRLATDGLVGFSTAPLRLATFMALLGAGISLVILAYILLSFGTGNTVPGWASLALIVTFFSSAQLLCIGIIGEYVGRTYTQVKQRPLYLIDDIVGRTRFPTE